MPIQPTYPGVYVEEISSGVRTITGVATSITAFIGAALRGPTDEPVTITSYSDYERTFGGLWVKSTMSYAVKDFYQNGGSVAVIIRIDNGALASIIELSTTDVDNKSVPLKLEAASKGSWGINLKASVNHQTKDAPPKETDNTPDYNKQFNLIITEKKDGGKTETFLNVSVDPNHPRFITRVLEQGSALVRVKSDAEMPENRPKSTIKPEEKDANKKIKTAASDKPVDAGFDNKDEKDTDGAVLTAQNYLDSFSLLEKIDLFNLLCIPPAERNKAIADSVYVEALSACVAKRAMLIVDAPPDWASNINGAATGAKEGLADFGLSGLNARNAALYYPLIKMQDPLLDGQVDTFVPCGMIAGIMSRTDMERGVWKAPAGIDASLNGSAGLQVNLTDAENGILNPLGINCLRSLPVTGRVVWGARTMRGADQLADEYKYIPVRRTALFIEESLYRGTQWVVFEPNDEALWAQIRLNIGAFMHNLFRQGAFQGKTPREAYLVKCDKETTTQNDINSGIVNILVGFAPLKPAEFVMIKLQQLAGQIDV